MTERVTLITGASAGIGTELARVFAANGHRLALTARRADRLEALASELAAKGGKKPIVIACDLTCSVLPALSVEQKRTVADAATVNAPAYDVLVGLVNGSVPSTV